MTGKLDFTISIRPVPLTPASPARTSPLSGPQANVNAVVAPYFTAPVNPQVSAYQQAEIKAYQEADILGKQINSLKGFLKDLDHQDINNVHFIQSLKQHLGADYRELCMQIAFALDGFEDFFRGESLLHQNFKILLRLKDQEGRNPLEQILDSLSEKLELQRGIANLNQIGALLSQVSSAPESQKGILQGKAIEIFKALPATPKGELCKKIWQLDGEPRGNAQYGQDEALKDIQKLLHYKDASPLQEAIQFTILKTQEKRSFSISCIYKEAISAADSKALADNILELYRLKDLKMLLDDPRKSNDVLHAKFKTLSTDLRNMIYKIIWLGCCKPDDFSSDAFVSHNVRALTDVVDDRGFDLIANLIGHYQYLITAQRLIDELKLFDLHRAGKNPAQLLDLFNHLNKTIKDGLGHRVWFEDGGKNDPHYGGWGYGTKKIENNPSCLFSGPNSPFALYLSSLEQRVSNANVAMLYDLEQQYNIPQDPIDVSSSRLLQRDLIHKLPPDLKTAVVTTEFARVASIGGLASSLDGTVRGLGGDSRLIMPLYLNGPISDTILASKREKTEYEVEHYGQKHKVFKVNIQGIRVYLIDAPELFWIPKKEDGTSGNFYNGDWDHLKKRWAVFQSLSEQLVYKMSKKEHPIQLVHVHDSQTALIPKLLAARHPEEWKQGKTPATVFTFHNNLDSNPYDDEPSLNALGDIGLQRRKLNPFIEGLKDADMVTTVSETFGKEAQTPSFGNGLHSFVKRAAFQGKLVGIINGNSNGWDPTQDEQLKTWNGNGTPLDLRYGPDTPDLAEKIKTIQRELCVHLRAKHFDDPAFADLDPEKPIVFYLGRYDSSQKGIDKLPLIMEEALRQGVQFVCIGTEPDPRAKDILENMKKRAIELNKKGVLVLEDRKVNGKFVYQGVFGSLLRAASALPIFPSLYEPCGLVQGELNRFGKRVVATRTGGFGDTLKTEGPDANGYLFKRCDDWYSEEQIEEIRRILATAIADSKNLMRALYHGSADEQRPFIAQMRTIMRNALNSTWEQTPDGSPHAIIRVEHVFAEAFRRREHRGQILVNLGTFK